MAAATVVRVEVERPIEWWRPFVQPFLCLPHLVANGVLTGLSGFVALAMGIAVLFTGRVPQGMARFQVMALRGRVRAYSYLFLLRRSFPPFVSRSVAVDPGDDPATTVAIEPPATAERWAIFRLLVVLPQIVVLLPIGALMDLGLPVLAIVCAVGRGWSPSMERFLIRIEQWVLAVVMYVVLVTDERPAWGFAAYADVDG